MKPNYVPFFIVCMASGGAGWAILNYFFTDRSYVVFFDRSSQAFSAL